MSNDWFQIIVAVLALAEAGVLVRALFVRGGTRLAAWVNLLLSAAILVYWLPRLPGELSFLRAEPSHDPADYQVPVLCLIECAILVPSIAALRRAPVPRGVIWLGFGFNFAITLFFAYLAFVLLAL
ncbi:MAG: hypothetical protein JO038_00570 [Alphaproteobacteria bacterium]|nr:hypothetical protein [Alphaproteobacteria bacterium]